MIEAGDVDWANHANNIDNSIGAVISGDDAFRATTQIGLRTTAAGTTPSDSDGGPRPLSHARPARTARATPYRPKAPDAE